MAVLSSLFILSASVTGLILSFEPIHREINFSDSKSNISLSELLEHLTQYGKGEITEIKVDDYGHTIASISNDNLDGEYYINPSNGTIIQKVPDQKWIFSFATNLHRSLFLKSTGRVIVAIVAFFLLMLTLTGVYLIIKRQNGLKRFFKKVNKSNIREADYHTILGRLQLLPIIIVTASGIALSLIRFDIIESQSGGFTEIEVKESEKVTVSEIPAFKSIQLSLLDHLEFPFSDDEEDYFYVTTSGVKKTIHQYTGQVIEVEQQESTYQLKSLSTFLHTGKGSVLWSLVLASACLGIFYFIYSGFVISYRRLSVKIKNKGNVNDAEYIILYGSENGQTKHLANHFLKALQQQGLRVYLLSLNEYKYFPSAKEIIIMTSTYGDGEAPSNANKFIKRFNATDHHHEIQYSILGFGSLAYKAYCQYAKDITQIMKQNPMLTTNVEACFINNSNRTDFKRWIQNWGSSHDFELVLDLPQSKLPKQTEFIVIERNIIDNEYETIVTLRLKPNVKTKFDSGDLLAIYPLEHPFKRQYSIGKIGDDILLSIKVHDKGICSQYLASLRVGNTLKGKIEINKAFHYPKNREVVMIANGTGIAPFMGMMHHQKTMDCLLFWGGKNRIGYQLYKNQIDEAMRNGTLSGVYKAYSRQNEKQYIQDVVRENIEVVLEKLLNGGVIMLCGSVSMQSGVFKILDTELASMDMDSITYYQEKGQILTDCY